MDRKGGMESKIVKHEFVLSGGGRQLLTVRDKNELRVLLNGNDSEMFRKNYFAIKLYDTNTQLLSGFLLDDRHTVFSNGDVPEKILNAVIGNDLDLERLCVAPVLQVFEWNYPLTSNERQSVNTRSLAEGNAVKLSLLKLFHSPGVLGILCFVGRGISGRESTGKNFVSLVDQLSAIVELITTREKIETEKKEEGKLAIIQKQQEQNTLLSIGKEMANIRNKANLFLLLNRQLKRHFEFEAVVISITDEDSAYYRPYLCDKSELYLKYPAFQRFEKQKFPVADGIYDIISASNQVVIFDLKKKQKQVKNAAYIDFWIGKGMNKLIGVPLKAGSKTIGILILYAKKGGRLLEKQVHFLQGICYHIGIVIDNILANDQLMLEQQEKSILLSISNSMTSVRTKEDLYAIISQKMDNIALFGELVIAVINEDKVTRSAYLYRSAQPGLFHEHAGFEQMATEKFPIDDGIMNVAMASASHVVFDIDELVNRTDVPPYILFWHSYGMREVVGIPLRAGSEPIGMLWVYLKEKDTLNKYHFALLDGVSSQITMALVNIKANEKISLQLKEINSYKQRLEEENSYLVKEIAGGFDYKEIIGKARSMQEVFHLVEKVAPSNSTVLILGETGTGKELTARAIHNGSPRKDKIMIKVNCAALPANLIESELFGHEKGSFTGAFEKRIGKFELANKGTLFLDEIGELPLELQVKLLRVLQEREIERIGGNTVISVDVRIIAATNRNLEQEVIEGKFRRDLFYRLNIVPIIMPPLRERKEDIPVLTTHFVNRYSKIIGKNIINVSKKAQQDLAAYDWPGNVRELEHVIERSVLLSSDNTLRHLYLPGFKSNSDKPITQRTDNQLKSLEENEREYILMALKKSKGKIFGRGGAAEILKIHVSTLNARIRKLNITKEHIFKTD